MSTAKQSTAGVRYQEIDATHAGQRLDNFLIARLKGVPRSHIYRILRRGEVRINRGRRAADYRLQEGDIVRIPPLRLATPANASRRQRPPSAPPQLAILYEDDYLLAVNKPAGLAVHGGSGVSLGLIEALRELRPRTGGLELVHRLDRDTSGCLLIAKRRSALLALHAQLRTGEVDKTYTALVRDRWQVPAQKVQAPLQKYQLRSGERVVEVCDRGKDAATRFVPRRILGDSTLVELHLLTGRTHQARVHAAHIGHPIAGDEKYGDRGFNQHMRHFGLKRLFLHASRLAFRHPRSGSRMRITAPLPAELGMVLKQMESK